MGTITKVTAVQSGQTKQSYTLTLHPEDMASLKQMLSNLEDLFKPDGVIDITKRIEEAFLKIINEDPTKSMPYARAWAHIVGTYFEFAHRRISIQRVIAELENINTDQE